MSVLLLILQTMAIEIFVIIYIVSKNLKFDIVLLNKNYSINHFSKCLITAYVFMYKPGFFPNCA